MNFWILTLFFVCVVSSAIAHKTHPYYAGGKLYIVGELCSKYVFTLDYYYDIRYFLLPIDTDTSAYPTRLKKCVRMCSGQIMDINMCEVMCMVPNVYKNV